MAFAIGDGDPTELTPPLYDVIDADGIERAFFGSDTNAGTRDGTARVEFRYAEYLVNIGSDGWVHVYEPTEPDGRR
ncbi:HalOD1 output domain-containing protein [Halobaculum rubrum]|uniref:HalOD1 output domain-containing protein n=1 Tax=Halobaculum rubrum TaxID=2872158 RepID=UPI003CE4B0BF